MWHTFLLSKTPLLMVPWCKIEAGLVKVTVENKFQPMRTPHRCHLKNLEQPHASPKGAQNEAPSTSVFYGSGFHALFFCFVQASGLSEIEHVAGLKWLFQELHFLEQMLFA